MRRTNSASGSRRRYYSRYLAHYTKKNSLLLLLGFLFLAGVVLGTLLVRSAGADTKGLLLRFIGDYSERRRGLPLVDNFFSGFSSSLILLGVLLVSGFCAIGQPVELMIPLLRGLGFGFSAASLYASYGVSAMGFVGVLMLPGMAISTIAILFCCNEALRLSGSLYTMVRGGEGELYALRLYLARFVASAMLCGIGALVEAALYMLFANSFVLG